MSSRTHEHARDYATFSKIAVERLKMRYPGLQTKGIKKAIIEAMTDAAFAEGDELRETCYDGVLCEFKELPRLIPDAFIIRETTDSEREQSVDDAALVCICYEVEDTNPLTIDKLEIYIAWWWMFDGNEHLGLRLVVTDRYGENEREIDLLEYERCLRKVRAA